MQKSSTHAGGAHAAARGVKLNKVGAIFADVLRGAAIGIAFIIPGFSGGSVAAILGIYEKLVGAIADIFKHFIKSMKVLLPIALGMLLGVAALILPIQWGLAYFPLPTVSLFVGLALGGLPPLKKQAGKPTKRRIFVFLLALIAAASLTFMPTTSHAEGFLYHLDLVGYARLALIGVIASGALVVPGISGSMLLLIFGYYEPLVRLITDFFMFGTGSVPVQGLLVLMIFVLGMLLGFVLISALMRKLLKSHPQGTYFAILGFILGSVAAVYAPVLRSSPHLANGWYWAAAVAMFVLGITLAYGFLQVAKRHKRAF